MTLGLARRQTGAIWFAISLLIAAFLSAPAAAHFLLNLNVRIFHVEHFSDGVKVYLRTPMPYLVADRIGPLGANGLPEPAPFTFNRIEQSGLVHYVDFSQVEQIPNGLGELAADGFRLVTEDAPLAATVQQVRVHRVGTQPDFATLDEAKAVFRKKPNYRDNTEPLYVGDTVVDIVLSYRNVSPVYQYSISSTLNPGLPDQDKTANLILDYSPGATKVFRARGLLAEPVTISRSVLSAVFTFIKEGVRHILEGADHVLFVICLVLGATRINSLAWRVTGFTIGHSVTLTIGFMGFVPAGEWFVPAVETGIAISIIYAAIIALSSHTKNRGNERTVFFVTSAIGFLHGLGFSFVLDKILQVNSPDIWQSLLAFNIGVEIGQLAIVLAIWPLFRLIRNVSNRAWRLSRLGISSICVAIALFWTYERSLSVISYL